MIKQADSGTSVMKLGQAALSADEVVEHARDMRLD
jgi:hypothetical protein